MRTLSLGWLTLSDASNEELVHAAAEAGFSAVGLRIAKRPTALGYGIAASSDITDRDVRRLSNALRECAISPLHAGGFWLAPDIDVGDYEHYMACGAELGCQMAVAVAMPNMLRSELVDGVGQLSKLADKYAMSIAIEFAVYTGVKTIEQAFQVADATGCANTGILVDALHLYRSGGTYESILAIPPERIFLAQLCDGPLRAPAMDRIPHEARHDRLDAGEGELPLIQFVNAIPSGVPLEVEVPKISSKGMKFVERAKLCFDFANAVSGNNYKASDI